MTHNSSAGNLLDEAKRLVCNERSEHHGDTERSFKVIAEFWQVYLRAAHFDAIVITPEDVCQMLSLLKKVRRIFGDKNNNENFIDDLGYTSIAGMFGGAPTPNVAKKMPSVVDFNALDREIRNESIR